MSGKIEISRELLQWAYDSIDEHVMNAESVKFLMLQALLAAPVVERQEPVGFVTRRDGKYGSWLHSSQRQAESFDSTAINGKPGNSEILAVYTSPPAPVSVAIDERAEFENYYRDRIMGNRTGVRFLRSSSGAYLDREVAERWSGWKARACLDKVEEMNK